MRILHLIDPHAGPCVQRMAAIGIGGLEMLHHDVIVIGHGRQRAVARASGLEPRGTVPAPLARAALARSGLRRYLRRAGRYEVIHAWSWPAAALALPFAAQSALVATSAVPPALSRRARHRWTQRGGQVLAISSAIARHNAGPQREAAAVLAPPIAGGAPDPRWRAALRDGLDLEPDTFLVGLLGEPITAADAEMSAHAAGRIRLAGRDVRLLLHPRSARRHEATRMLRRVGIARGVIANETLDEPWRLAAALDACLLLSRGAATNALPALWAMAAAVPVIVERSPMTDGLVADGRGGWLVPPGDLHAAAERLLELVDDRAGARRLGEIGREVVAQRHDPVRFARRLGEAYEQAARGERIRCEDEPSVPIVETRRVERTRVS